MPDTTDPAASALDEIRERAGAAAAMDVDILSAFNGVSVGGVIAASAVDVPRLFKAVEAALAHHVEAVIEDMPEPRFRYCKTCSGHPAWPCPEVAAITAELAGEADDEH